MPGVFDDLEWTGAPAQQAEQKWSYEDPASYWQANLDPQYAQRLLAQMDAGARDPTRGLYGGSGYIDGYHATGVPTLIQSEGGPDGGSWETGGMEPRQIRRLLNDGSYYYDMWDPQTGQYLGRQGDEGSWVQIREGLKVPAAFAAMAYGGGELASAVNGAGAAGAAGAGTAAASGGGMTAAEAAAAGVTDLGIGQGSLALGGNGFATAAGTAGAGGATSLLDQAKTLYQGADQFLNSGVGKLLGTGAALALSKDVNQGPADPMLTNANERLTQTGDSAINRANADDEYFRSVFMPKYMALMDQANARDKELYDFNMGRARLAAGQLDKFYAGVDAFDSEAGQREAAGKAVAGARQSNQAAANMLRRQAEMRGLNPGSGAWGAGAAQLASRAALNEAMAGNMARTAAKREGLNLRATAAGLTGAAGAYAGNAAAGANMGLNATGNVQQNVQSNSNLWNATTGLGLGAFTTTGNWGLNRSSSADSLAAMNAQGWNGLLGYGLGQLLNNRSTGAGK